MEREDNFWHMRRNIDRRASKINRECARIAWLRALEERRRAAEERRQAEEKAEWDKTKEAFDRRLAAFARRSGSSKRARVAVETEPKIEPKIEKEG